jgi:hypothetical protein
MVGLYEIFQKVSLYLFCIPSYKLDIHTLKGGEAFSCPCIFPPFINLFYLDKGKGNDKVNVRVIILVRLRNGKIKELFYSMLLFLDKHGNGGGSPIAKLQYKPKHLG